MLKNHLIDATISPESLLSIRTAMSTLATELGSFGVSLDETQTRHYQHMGMRNETFSRDILDLAEERPQLVPLTIDLPALQRDVTAREQLAPIVLQLQAITKLAEDTYAAFGIDIFNGSRALYLSMKVIAKINGIADIIARIGQRFAGQGKRRQNQTPTPPTVTSEAPDAPTQS